MKRRSRVYPAPHRLLFPALSLFLALAAASPFPSAAASQLRLSWWDNSDNEAGFEIERSADGAPFQPLAMVDQDITTYLDQSVEAGVEYQYRVRAFNAFGRSRFSNKAKGSIARLNTPPSIAPLDNISLTEGMVPQSISLQISDAETSVDQLEVSLNSSNRALVRRRDLDLTRQGNGLQLDYVLMPGLAGETTLTVVVSDGELHASETFTVTVRPKAPEPPTEEANDDEQKAEEETDAPSPSDPPPQQTASDENQPSAVDPSPAPAPDPPPPPHDPGILANGGFDTDMSSWSFYTDGLGSAMAAAPGYADTPKAAQITLLTGGSNIQLYQSDVTVHPDIQYELVLAAYSDSGHDVRVSLVQHDPPYTNHGLNRERLDLGTDWQIHRLEFSALNLHATTRKARLLFWFADDARPGDRYFLDHLRLAPIEGTADPDPAPAPPPPSDSNDHPSSPDLEPNLLTEVIANGAFDDGLSSWNFYTSGLGNASLATAANGDPAALITTLTAAANIQLYQSDLALEPRASYRLTFDAYSTSGRDLRVSLSQHSAPYANYGLNREPFDLATSWTTHTLDFQTINFDGSANDGRLYFWLADDARPGDKFFIDNVSLTQRQAALPPSPPQQLQAVRTPSGEVRLAWQPPSDATTAPLGYIIYRDGNDIGETATTTFTDPSPPPNPIYTITAFDPSGNESPPSAPATPPGAAE